MEDVSSKLIFLFLILFFTHDFGFCGDTCDPGDNSICSQEPTSKSSVYAKEASYIVSEIEKAEKEFKPCHDPLSCYSPVIQADLKPFKGGITKDMISEAEKKGTKYQIIDGQLYRSKDCMFPARCSGIEHFILNIIAKLPDIEFIINTRDWPQISTHFDKPIPVFSFSKTRSYYDIMYPAWSFWSGGPAISLYPKGIGRWDVFRKALKHATEKWPWNSKKPTAFFRGSRTSDERDQLILLSRDSQDLVDAAFTKNQAWKSDKDTLYAPPAEEVSLEDHCKFKYLFNFRGVAASFRLKYLFLCKSLVFHVGDEWQEFFYPALKKWIHYIPVPTQATKSEIRALIEFFKEHDDLSRKIAERGHDFIASNLKFKDIEWYWKTLLNKYAKLLTYKPTLDESLILIERSKGPKTEL